MPASDEPEYCGDANCAVCAPLRGGPREGQSPEVPESTEPEIRVPVQLTTADAREILLRSDLISALTGADSAEVWAEAFQTFAEARGSAYWEVQPGGYAIPNDPVRGQDGGGTMEYVTVEDAREVVGIVTNGSLTLERIEGGDDAQPRYGLVPTGSPLERGAWEAYARTSSSRSMAATDPNTIPTYAIRDVIRSYRGYRRSGARTRLLRETIRANMTVPTPHVSEHYTPEQIEKFRAFVDTKLRKLSADEDPFKDFVILPRKTLASRTWGIEIEAVDVAGVNTPRGWYKHSDGSLRTLEDSSQPSRTKPRTDLGYGAGCEYCTRLVTCTRCNNAMRVYSQKAEWSSPVLRSFHSRGLEYLSEMIEGRNTNDSAGVHVHVAADDMTPLQTSTVALYYSMLEPLFESAYMRNTRQYCPSLNTDEIINRFRMARSVKTKSNKAEDMQFGSRYWTVNQAALSVHNTIEFRAMGPVYNYELLLKWAYFCRELVNIVRAGVPQQEITSVKTMRDIITLFYKYGKETAKPEWAKTNKKSPEKVEETVVAKLGVENRRTPNTQEAVNRAGKKVVSQHDDYSSEDVVYA